MKDSTFRWFIVSVLLLHLALVGTGVYCVVGWKAEIVDAIKTSIVDVADRRIDEYENKLEALFEKYEAKLTSLSPTRLFGRGDD